MSQIPVSPAPQCAAIPTSKEAVQNITRTPHALRTWGGAYNAPGNHNNTPAAQCATRPADAPAGAGQGRTLRSRPFAIGELVCVADDEGARVPIGSAGRVTRIEDLDDPQPADPFLVFVQIDGQGVEESFLDCQLCAIEDCGLDVSPHAVVQ